MRIHTQGTIALFAAAALAACGGTASDSSLEQSAAEHVVACEGFTPGFWCGGASTATNDQCDNFYGFTSCADMCECFVGPISANAGQNRDGCPSTCASGDVLQKFWVALQLSNPTIGQGSNGIQCPGQCDGGQPECQAWEIEAELADCSPENRNDQLAIAACIDDILNVGGFCVFD